MMPMSPDDFRVLEQIVSVPRNIDDVVRHAHAHTRTHIRDAKANDEC